MMRLIQWAFNRTATVSAVLCLAACVLWLLSRADGPAVQLWTSRGLWEMAVRDGVFWIDNEPQRELDRAPDRLLERRVLQLRDRRETIIRQVAQAPVPTADQARKIGAELDDVDQAQIHLEVPWMWPQPWPWPRATITPPAGRSLRCRTAVVSLALFPAMRLLQGAACRRRRAACRKKGICTECGYDLRATRNRCPECGTAVKEII